MIFSRLGLTGDSAHYRQPEVLEGMSLGEGTEGWGGRAEDGRPNTAMEATRVCRGSSFREACLRCPRRYQVT